MSNNSKEYGVTIQERPVDVHEKLGNLHVNLLPKKKLIIVLLSLSMSMFISFADQTGVTVALPRIGQELNSQKTINWAGTASLLANTVCQVLFGRLSDIYGRKTILLGSLIILAISDLACGFAQTGIQFYVFRAFAGIGNGGVSSLCMVILSDVVTLEQRGKYQGILGASIGLGNAVGPFLMSAFTKSTSWRNFYHLLAPLNVVIAAALYYLIPGKETSLVLSPTQKLRTLDYWGMLTSTISITLLLVAVSSGGSTYAWNSAVVISLFCVGGVAFIAFLLVEWKIPELPMIPLKLFLDPLLCLILASNFFFGAAYYSTLFNVPYYFQIVKGHGEIKSSVFILPLVLLQAAFSTVSGNIVSYTGHYIFVVLVGFALWTLGNGLFLLWDLETSAGVIVGVMLIVGVGVGCTFQPTMVAAQAHSKKADRAVVISTRNVLRSFGGAVGIAIASTIITNMMNNEIDNATDHPEAYDNISSQFLAHLKSDVFAKIDTSTLSTAQEVVVRKMYLRCIRGYFYLAIPLIGVCLIANMFVKDNGLKCADELEQDSTHTHSESETTGTMTMVNSHTSEHKV